MARVLAVATPDDMDMRRISVRIARLLVVGRIDLGLVLSAIWVMFVKPTGGNPGALVLMTATTATRALGPALRRGMSTDEQRLDSRRAHPAG